jgi:alpha-glucosidase
MLLLTLRGTPTLYYGDELAIGHVEIPLNKSPPLLETGEKINRR